jgi:hypothetical protein
MAKQRYLLLVIAMACCLFQAATTEARIAQKDDPYAKVIDTMIENEFEMVATLAEYSPIVETYMQHFTPDKELGAVPSKDVYFLTKVKEGKERTGNSMTPKGGFLSSIGNKLKGFYSLWYDRMGLVDMILIDDEGLTREGYDFKFVRKEFLGDVRCLVFDVQPTEKRRKTGFSGRIWVEDEGYNIVRFNGIKGIPGMMRIPFHADSWRQNLNGHWLPIYVYSEESDVRYAPWGKLTFKAQTRLWGYNIKDRQRQDERTSLVVESDTIRDGGADSTFSDSPVLGARAWQRQAEDNVIERMEEAGLLAPESEVDAILKTVATNLEITNDLAFDPPLRARVLLTSPIESFTIGHTIVLSRGLIDVLPDEASLAMVIAHEVGHMALGHSIGTKYAFSDRMLFEDHEAFAKLFVKRTPAEEQAADTKALELLKKSPYQDKLANAGLFLKAVQNRAKQLPNLLRAHLGNQIAVKNQIVRMNSLIEGAPELEVRRVDQIAALPLGGRVRVNAWDATITLAKSKPVALLGAQEKRPFEITPLFPHLTREVPKAIVTTGTELKSAGQ